VSVVVDFTFVEADCVDVAAADAPGAPTRPMKAMDAAAIINNPNRILFIVPLQADGVF
jgi:hypothetical protein